MGTLLYALQKALHLFHDYVRYFGTLANVFLFTQKRVPLHAEQKQDNRDVGKKTMDELLVEFLTETNENLEELDLNLVKLEQNPNDKDLLSVIFRVMHTIKGTCGFLSLPRLEKVAHHGENLLGRFRDGDLEVTPEYVTLILESLDRVRLILAGIEETGEEPEGDDTELIKKLDIAYESGSQEDSDAKEEKPKVVKGKIDISGNIPIEELLKIAEEQDMDLDASDKEKAEENPAEPKETTPVPVDITENQDIPKESAVAAQSLRVNVDVLEDLMTMVSELVLTRNQLLQTLRAQQENEFSAPLQRLNHVVSELQEGVMKTRMQPIGNAWAKLPRIIRDLSLELGKKVELEMRGQDTELDRQVLELIRDPLTHMVRNSVDHGLETPEERIAAGKPEIGKVRLVSYHEGGHVIIRISDDGYGLAIDKIKKKVLANKLATPAELEEMSSQQIQQFIFNAGFSTAETVTAVSGRGVGMDVVRTNIEKIGGSIELKSVEGKGTTFTIKIPLTLAIISALIVEAGGERFAIPQLAVRELVMASHKGNNRIERIKGTPVIRLRDHLLPLISLVDLLELKGNKKSPTASEIKNDPEEKAAAKKKASDKENTASDKEGKDKSKEGKDKSKEGKDKSQSSLKKTAGKSGLEVTNNPNQYIVVAQVGAYYFGIIVERVYDTEEIVVKPVATILRDIDIFSGNTILGDGNVIMILDPTGIAKASGEIELSDSMDESLEEEVLEFADTRTSLLLFCAAGRAPKAVPLELVSRLEEIKLSDIEWADDQMVVQYRGHLMPLMPFDQSGALDEKTEETKPVLVFADENHAMGLVVDKIIDITEQHVDIQMEGSEGLLGSAIIEGKSTDVIDVSFYLKKVNTKWFLGEGNEAFSVYKASGRKRILLVEDSPFFRSMLTPILQFEGYEVTVLEDAMKALELCEAGASFDAIISDIEMPEINGYEFARRVKAGSAWEHIPMIALTSHAAPRDIEKSHEAGFLDHVAKFDRETLINSLSDVLAEQS